MDKTKIGQNIKFCPIFDATLVHEFMCDAIAEPNPRYPTVYDSYLVDDALKEPLQHHWIKCFTHDVIAWVKLSGQHLCHDDVACLGFKFVFVHLVKRAVCTLITRQNRFLPLDFILKLMMKKYKT